MISSPARMLGVSLPAKVGISILLPFVLASPLGIPFDCSPLACTAAWLFSVRGVCFPDTLLTLSKKLDGVKAQGSLGNGFLVTVGYLLKAARLTKLYAG